ncbi:hypothetical protein Zmor_005950 [Zophobas morio]|uniref:Uncharacterized protein n=1 Tax=Zophobas morio TaxID=2755281 RepID=A0AA38IYM9_9CUCU|nr:hypothetical protein Zmor_005950 [Zophobas morio]
MDSKIQAFIHTIPIFFQKIYSNRPKQQIEKSNILKRTEMPLLILKQTEPYLLVRVAQKKEHPLHRYFHMKRITIGHLKICYLCLEQVHEKTQYEEKEKERQ